MRVIVAPSLLVALVACASFAQVPTQGQFDEIGGDEVVEKLGAQVPLTLGFQTEDGRYVTLGDVFDGNRPVLMTLNYYRCPGICTVQLNGVVNLIRDLKWKSGDKFRLVTVSFDPDDTSAMGMEKKKNYLAQLEDPSIGDGWWFLTGSQANIRALVDTVGFKFRKDQSGQFQHPSVLIVLSPQGQVMRYLGGVAYDPQAVELSLVEASQGKIQPSLGQFIRMSCFVWDPQLGKYVPVAWMIMRTGAVISLIVLGIFLGTLFVLDRRRWSKVKPLEAPVAAA